jgi:hypothetical protein
MTLAAWSDLALSFGMFFAVKQLTNDRGRKPFERRPRDKSKTLQG